MVMAVCKAHRKGVRVTCGLNPVIKLGTFADVLEAAQWCEENGYFLTTEDDRERKTKLTRGRSNRRPVRKVKVNA